MHVNAPYLFARVNMVKYDTYNLLQALTINIANMSLNPTKNVNVDQMF